jgi:hypothetical protein
LFLANQCRAGLPAESTQFAEELTVSWWQGCIHQQVFPGWLSTESIFHVNDDFLLVEGNQESRSFWKVAYVFEQYRHFPWVEHVLSRLPARSAYIGERPDLSAVIRGFSEREEAKFLAREPLERFAIPSPFESYPPRDPSVLRVRLGRSDQ